MGLIPSGAVYRDSSGSKKYTDASGKVLKTEERVYVKGGKVVPTGTKGSSRGVLTTTYNQENIEKNLVATKLISDLNASATRINERKSVSRAGAEFIARTPEIQTIQTATTLHNFRKNRLERSPYTDAYKEEQGVVGELQVLKTLDVEPTMNYFTSSKGKKQFLVKYDDTFRESLGGELGERAFIETKELQTDGFKPLETLRTRRENRKILRDVYGIEGGGLSFVEPDKKVFTFRDIIFGSDKPSGVVFKDKLPMGEPLIKLPKSLTSSEEFVSQRESFFSDAGEILKKSFIEGWVYTKETFIEPDKKVFTFRDIIFGSDKPSGVVFRDKPFIRMPSKSEASGLGMAGYTAVSLPGNVISPTLMQGIDVALAADTYLRSFVNPTPMNRAWKNWELIDVAIDYVPEVAGVIAGGAAGLAGGLAAGGAVGSAGGGIAGSIAGLKIGRLVPTPNFNVNFTEQTMNINAPTPSSFRQGKSELGFGEGFVEIPASYVPQVEFNIKGSKNVFIPDVNLGERNVFAEGYGSVNENMNLFADENLNIFGNENINENLNQNININENLNQNMNINANVNANIYANIYANVNANVNANIMFDVNENVNFMFTSPKQKGRRKNDLLSFDYPVFEETYNPSIEAELFDVRSKKRKKDLLSGSGLKIRPIIIGGL